ncbi:hypothetical protein RIF29_00861 [Crotalaria pallida]|uniref:Uncharacterized protein n=1 Tax=Crotalaria pallida TaxID=3830 RepID=A0AAN9IW58_CROPI
MEQVDDDFVLEIPEEDVQQDTEETAESPMTQSKPETEKMIQTKNTEIGCQKEKGKSAETGGETSDEVGSTTNSHCQIRDANPEPDKADPTKKQKKWKRIPKA